MAGHDGVSHVFRLFVECGRHRGHVARAGAVPYRRDGPLGVSCLTSVDDVEGCNAVAVMLHLGAL